MKDRMDVAMKCKSLCKMLNYINKQDRSIEFGTNFSTFVSLLRTNGKEGKTDRKIQAASKGFYF